MKPLPPPPPSLPHPVVDNHTHYDMVLEEAGPEALGRVLDVAEQVGIARAVQVGCDLESSRWAVEAATWDRRLTAAVALHPNEAPRLAEQGVLGEALDGIADLSRHPRVRAVGETGLDFFRTGTEGHAAQFESFEFHIALAKERGLTLQIHDRQAHQEVVNTLRRVGAPEQVVFHCFSGGGDLARTCAEEGWYMSFAGTVTFKNAPDLREALSVAPPELVLLETDAPFLTPHPHRGQPNTSYLAAHTLRFMAEHRRWDLERACRLVWENSHTAYGRWNDE